MKTYETILRAMGPALFLPNGGIDLNACEEALARAGERPDLNLAEEVASGMRDPM